MNRKTAYILNNWINRIECFWNGDFEGDWMIALWKTMLIMYSFILPMSVVLLVISILK